MPKPPGGDGSDIGAFEVQSPGDAHPELVGSVRPKVATAGTLECFRLAVRSGGGPVGEVAVTLGGERDLTNRRGEATICKRFGRPGHRLARFRKRGFEADTAHVLVLRRAARR